MTVRRMCPYKTNPRHFITINITQTHTHCPKCGKQIQIAHSLSGHVTLHTMRETPNLQKKVFEYVKNCPGSTITGIARGIGDSYSRVWYLLQGMSEIEIEKKGRRCYVGVRG